jgi:arsenate reductase (glutaredoxin)
MTTLYGIPNCDTVKKARAWLDAHEIVYTFHDYKKSGAVKDKLATWCATAGWEKILNRAGTTFKKLPDTDKTALNLERAIALMLAQPSMIKRPIIEHKNGLLIGFDASTWQAALAR